ncbi:MAG TPA: SpvB/TcaC N-terminal domain-containing protein [Pyrinomonadaceae bacterium]|nr:SpvB/TcaC N-terminal domain-containing protein [Pyrinomonadaceae bacterium]
MPGTIPEEVPSSQMGTAAPGPTDAPNQASLPAISLPKGGGAIRGIGEKFTANAVTGTGSLTVPIATSPGRSGFGPQLSLSYDSGSGNGPFGIGWNLSSQAITRRTDKGIPQYRDAGESDVFILSGAEDLVPALKKDERGSWVADEFEREGYCVKRYRPRIEGLFARIERWRRLRDGDVHWRSISKDNILTVYGSDSESRIHDPANRNHVFSWLICQSYDDKGNAISYEYAAENDIGVDLTKAGERNRTRAANRYLKRIKYGNRLPLLLDTTTASFRKPHFEHPDLRSADWMFEVVFDYGVGHYREEPPDERGRVIAEACTILETDAAWPTRKDPFSSYRAGFEVRIHRLCKRVLMFHCFPEELGVDHYLVRATEFEYQEKPTGSFITRVVQSGFKRQGEEGYLKKSLPSLDLNYTSSPLEDPAYAGYQLQEVDRSSLENLPFGIDGQSYRWVDLDGEGISGVLSEQGTGWFYKANLGNGHFGSTELVTLRPSIASLGAGRQQFMDVAGDGNLDLVDFSAAASGFYERTPSGDWKSFRNFTSLPNANWNDPNLKFVDVTGDGLADVLITEDEALTWLPSLLKEGFGPAIRVRVPLDEEEGPRVVFGDKTQSIYLADMSGDGLSDIARIRNGEVCYWPNLGYGRFGSKVTMSNAPWFDNTDLFDQPRIRLSDTDGSGTTDIIYLGRDDVRIFLNEVGNGWSNARVLEQFPAINNLTSISVVDFLGRGTACLLWSSPLPGESVPLKYVDLMAGQKPHLLTRAQNNLGAETVIEYASSTEFYLADKSAGTPWITRLPFPVHVVKRVETYDHISRNRFVTRYAYHHGYFDGIEREFRGFGRVDQLDTEEFAALTESGEFPVGDNIDAASHVPPVLTKTWLHTGAFLDGKRISKQFEHEYYREGDPGRGESELSREEREAMLLDDTILPERLTLEEAREASRSLKGTMLRQELYALDGREESRRPYTVSELNYTIKPLQSRNKNRHAVFLTHPRETLAFSYERKLYDISGCVRADPRVTHSATLEVDEFGNVLKSVAVGYGRRFQNASPIFTEADRSKQQQTLLTLTENRYTNAVRESDAYRAPLLCDAETFELINLKPNAKRAGVTNLFRFSELVEQVRQASDGSHDLSYEDLTDVGAIANAPYRRLLRAARTEYRRNDLTGLLPHGQLQSLALPGESYRLAFTPGLLTQIYRRLSEDLLPDSEKVLRDEGGYIRFEGNWWRPSGQTFYSPEREHGAIDELDFAQKHFFLAHRFRDPFQNENLIIYDRYQLLMVSSRDPIGNEITVRNDYRVLQPYLMTDPNGNRAEFAFDALGMVAGTAMMGKEDENVGDSLVDFRVDLVQQELDRFFSDPRGLIAADLLGDATTRIVYDLNRSLIHGKTSTPVYAATITRETHVSDLQPEETSKLQVGFSYSDGFAREIQKKIQAEPGRLDPQEPTIKPRWIGSGWTIFNNKGKPVKQYEPFFDDTHDFRFARRVGVSSTIFYDPVERVVATLKPNHTWEKIVVDAWSQATWDVNDTVLIADPGADEHVGSFFQRLPAADYLPTWHSQRTNGSLGPEEQKASVKAATHAGTPTVAHADTLGRAYLTIADNGPAAKYTTRSEIDIDGNQREVIDAKNRIVMRYDYDMLRTHILEASMEAGAHWVLNDVGGKGIRAWDSRNHQFRTAYDSLRRPTESFVKEGAGVELLVGRTVYGETRPNPEADNLRGKVVQLFDQACVVTSDEYDFKGNLRQSRRQLAQAYHTPLDWSAAVPLQTDLYTTRTRYDALNRPIEVTMPDNSVIRHVYNEGKQLVRVEANLLGAQQNGQPVWSPFVTNIDYDAKGRRTLIDYGNSVSTIYSYDPLTLRLVQLCTRRNASSFPDDCRQPPPSGWPGCQVQNLHYIYDPVGNVTHISDEAQQTIFFRNKRVEPSVDYSYDAIYRLIEATGREHLGQIRDEPAPSSYNDKPRVGILLSASDANAMGRYVERYLYDNVGNFQEMIHRGSDSTQPGWTRTYAYNEPSLLELDKVSNRLSKTTVGGTIETYSTGGNGYDAHGDMLRMPHLQIMQWDFKDHLQLTQRQAVNAEDEESIQRHGERTWYVYDVSGQRVRKVTESASGKIKDERIYLGSFEIYRKHGAHPLVRTTLHIMDDTQRVALVETRIEGDEPDVPAQLIRYQFGNHLSSASLELDDEAKVISYEEYTPYGSTSFQAVRSQTETPKRYRYTGKERDEENGLCYHGARYYAPWLGRWTACDPAGTVDGLNAYAYVRDNPVGASDPTGRWSTGWTIVAIVAVVVVVAVVAVVTLGTGAAPAGAAGAAILGAGAEVAAGTTAVVATGAEVAVGATAVVATGAEVAVGTTAVVATGAEVTAGTTAAVATGAEVSASTTAVSGGLTAAQASGLGTAATTVAAASQTPAGQHVIESIEENLPALENEAQVAVQEVQSVLPRLQSVAPQAQNVTQAAAQQSAPAARAVQAASQALDPNRLNHIFGKAEHALDEFVSAQGGREQAFRTIQDAANQALREGKLIPGPNGVLPSGDAGPIIDVAGTQVRLIGGRVVEGVVQIASASRKGL